MARPNPGFWRFSVFPTARLHSVRTGYCRRSPSRDGERDATAYGPTAPKGDYPPQYAPLFPEVVIPGEDCLNLNARTPGTNATGLPVLVWIHGGSFMNGSGSVF